uniref:Mrr-like domain-containing protein n=1 Tax=viral metagenome TaxID=1070528 RepID=A0A6C0I5H9_9ZZZZ
MESLLHTIFLKSPLNLWDAFEEECQKFYEQPAHTFTEMRTRDNKKVRGDIFEDFCVLYLKNVLGYTNVWRLPDVPEDVLEKLTLKRRDTGIDIIAERDGQYSAVQCKYKKHVSFKKNVVTWKALSTFYAMCMRTGPYQRYIVMTNCSYVTHMGKKTAKDLSICLGTLRKTTKEEWTRMCKLEENTMECSLPLPKTVEQLRAARLAFFTK